MSTEKLEIGICDDSIEDLKKIHYKKNRFMIYIRLDGKQIECGTI